MKFKLVHLVIFFISSNAFGLTLKDAFEHAKKHRPSFKVQVLSEQIAEKEKSQTYSGFFPTLSFNQDNDWVDSLSSSYSTNSYQRTSKFTLSQPLFQGGAEYSALAIAKNNLKMSKADTSQKELDLFNEVAQAYFNQMKIEQEIKTLTDQKKLLSRRVRLLLQRAKIGRSKDSEVIAARSQLARISAELVKSESDLQLSKSHFNWLTGLQERTPLVIPYEINKINFDLITEQHVLSRPAIRSKELEVKIAKNNISASKAEYWPDIDLSANYYVERFGSSLSSDWDITLGFSWELFSGRSTVNEVSIQKLKLQQAEYELADMKQKKLNEFRSQREKLKLQKQTLKALEKAEKLAQINYKEQNKEFRRGLISNLDVLNAYDDYLVVKRMYDNELFASQLTWIEYNLIAGKMP